MLEMPGGPMGGGFSILPVGVAQVGVRSLVPADRLPGRRASTRDLGEMFEQVQRRLAELDDLRKRLDEVEEMQRRLGEVEERLDFAERLLAKQREGERLAPPRRDRKSVV